MSELTKENGSNNSCNVYTNIYILIFTKKYDMFACRLYKIKCLFHDKKC